MPRDAYLEHPSAEPIWLGNIVNFHDYSQLGLSQEELLVVFTKEEPLPEGWSYIWYEGSLAATSEGMIVFEEAGDLVFGGSVPKTRAPLLLCSILSTWNPTHRDRTCWDYFNAKWGSCSPEELIAIYCRLHANAPKEDNPYLEEMASPEDFRKALEAWPDLIGIKLVVEKS